MSIKVNKSVYNSKPYKLTTQKAWLESDKSKVMKLDWNESTIPPSPKVISSLQDLVKNGLINWYPNIQNSELVEKLSKYCNVKSHNVQYFNGSDAIHESIFKTFSDNNDILTIVGPTYDHPRSVAECFGLSIDFFYLTKDFDFNKNDFKNYMINTNPTLVYICNPNNPVGNIYSNELLSELLSEFPDSLFIIDEAYQEFYGLSCVELINKFPNLIVTRTFSKAFGLASLRLGYCISSKENISLINKFRNPKSINLFAQVAAIAAMDDLDYTKKYVSEVLEGKEMFINYIDSNLSKYITPVNGFGNFILFKLSKKFSPPDFMNFLEKRKIYIRNYSHIKNLENHLRATIGNKAQTEYLISAFEEYFS